MTKSAKKIAVYQILNVVNHKFYIGSSANLYQRWRTHRNKLRSNTHPNKYLQASWNKYGERVFIFEILAEFEGVKDMLACEEGLIQTHIGSSLCMNLTRWVDTPMRGRVGEAHPNYGKPVPEERKALIRKATYKQWAVSDPRTGRTHSEETKQRIRAIRLANPTRAWLGKTRSEETRKKIGDAQRGVAKAPRTFTPDGLKRVQENMKRNAKQQLPADFSVVKAAFPQVVLDKYDFSSAVYTGAANRIQGCVCPKHGLFTQYVYQFKKGRGCPTCGGEQRAESKRKQMKEAWENPEEREKMMAVRTRKKDCTR